MSRAHNPYGDGKACARIIEFLKERANDDRLYGLFIAPISAPANMAWFIIRPTAKYPTG